MSRRAKVWTALWAVYIIWGSTYLFIAIAVDTIPPLAAVSTRFIAAGLILAAIVAFRNGDFSVRLPVDWDETDGRIAEALNQTISQEDRITQEVERVSIMVGKEGRLKQRNS